MTPLVGAIAKISLTNLEPSSQRGFNCRESLISLPDVPPAPPRGIGPKFGYYHCQPMTEAHDIKLKELMKSELDRYSSSFRPDAIATYGNYSREEVNRITKKDFGTMSAIKVPESAFLIASHGTHSHLVRWPSVVLLPPKLNGEEATAQMKGYWTARLFLDHIRCHELCTDKIKKFEECEYIIILACNSGNEMDPEFKYTPQCFAQELANLSNKPCYAPEGYLLYTEDSEPSAWPKLQVDPRTNMEYGVGAQRPFKMFYPPYYAKKIEPPKRINLNVN